MKQKNWVRKTKTNHRTKAEFTICKEQFCLHLKNSTIFFSVDSIITSYKFIVAQCVMIQFVFAKLRLFVFTLIRKRGFRSYAIYIRKNSGSSYCCCCWFSCCCWFTHWNWWNSENATITNVSIDMVKHKWESNKERMKWTLTHQEREKNQFVIIHFWHIRAREREREKIRNTRWWKRNFDWRTTMSHENREIYRNIFRNTKLFFRYSYDKNDKKENEERWTIRNSSEVVC